MMPPCDHPTSTAALRNVGGASTATVGQINAREVRDDCDCEHLVVKDEQREQKGEALAYLSGYINIDHELEQDQLKEMGIYDDEANEFDEINIQLALFACTLLASKFDTYDIT